MRLYNKNIFVQKDNLSYLSHMWFKFHSKFFGSLIKDGKRISAYNILFRVKYGIKLREFHEPNIIFLISMLQISPFVFLYYKKMGRFYKVFLYPLKRINKLFLLSNEL